MNFWLYIYDKFLDFYIILYMYLFHCIYKGQSPLSCSYYCHQISRKSAYVFSVSWRSPVMASHKSGSHSHDRVPRIRLARAHIYMRIMRQPVGPIVVTLSTSSKEFSPLLLCRVTKYLPKLFPNQAR